MVLFVKEMRTCNYVMVIHTPRLCGVPGFHTRLEQRAEAPVRCREILPTQEDVASAMTDAETSGLGSALVLTPYPRSRKPRLAALDMPPETAADEAQAHEKVVKPGLANPTSLSSLMHDALRMILGDQLSEQFEIEVIDGGELRVGGKGDGDEDEDEDGDEEGEGEGAARTDGAGASGSGSGSGSGSVKRAAREQLAQNLLDTERLAEVLRAAGYDVQELRGKPEGEEDTDADAKKSGAHEEL